MGKDLLPARGKAAFTLVGITLLGAALRLWDLGEKSFWIDELISLCHAETIHDVASFLTPTCGNAHPPLYFLILKGWSVFGGGEVYLRLLSVLFGVTVIPAAYFLGRELLEERAATVAAFLVAVSPFHLQYDREVRMYSLLACLTIWSLYFFLRALKTGKLAHWTLYTGLSAVSVYVHYHAFMVLLFEWVFFLANYSRYRTQRVNAVISQAVIAVCFVPWFPGLLYQIKNPAQFALDAPDKFPIAHGAWIVKPLYLLYSMSLGQTLLPWNVLAIVGSLIFGGVAIFSIRALRGRSDAGNFLVLYLMIPVVAGMLFSLVMPRYFLFLAPAYYLLLAQGIVVMRSVGVKLAVLIGLLLPMGVSAANYYRNQEFHILAQVDPWREVGAYIRGHAKPEDCVIAIGSSRPLGYYLDSYKGFSQPIYNSDFEQSRECLEGRAGRRVWLVGADPAVRTMAERAKSWLEARYTQLAEKRFFRDSDYQIKAKLFKKDFLEYRISVYLYGAT